MLSDIHSVLDAPSIDFFYEIRPGRFSPFESFGKFRSDMNTSEMIFREKRDLFGALLFV